MRRKKTKIFQKINEIEKLFSSYHPRIETIYKKKYYCFDHDGVRGVFHILFEASLANKYSPKLFLQLKIPQTNQVKIYLAHQLSGVGSEISVLQKMGGWTAVGDGFLLGHLNGVTIEQQKETFARMADPLRIQMKSFSANYGALNIRPGWAEFYIGKKNAEKLFDPSMQADLDLQTSLAIKEDTRTDDLRDFVTRSIELCQELSQHIGTQSEFFISKNI